MKASKKVGVGGKLSMKAKVYAKWWEGRAYGSVLDES
jgi:hypothetical protein